MMYMVFKDAPKIRYSYICLIKFFRSNWSSDVHKHIRLKRTGHTNAFVIRLDEIEGGSIGFRLNTNVNSSLSMVVVEKAVPDMQHVSLSSPQCEESIENMASSNSLKIENSDDSFTSDSIDNRRLLKAG